MEPPKQFGALKQTLKNKGLQELSGIGPIILSDPKWKDWKQQCRSELFGYKICLDTASDFQMVLSPWSCHFQNFKSVPEAHTSGLQEEVSILAGFQPVSI